MALESLEISDYALLVARNVYGFTWSQIGRMQHTSRRFSSRRFDLLSAWAVEWRAWYERKYPWGEGARPLRRRQRRKPQ